MRACNNYVDDDLVAGTKKIVPVMHKFKAATDNRRPRARARSTIVSSV